MLFVLHVKQYYRLLDFELEDNNSRTAIKYLINHFSILLFAAFRILHKRQLFFSQDLYLWLKLVYIYMMNGHKMENARGNVPCWQLLFFTPRTARALEAGAKVPALISSTKEARGIEWQP